MRQISVQAFPKLTFIFYIFALLIWQKNKLVQDDPDHFQTLYLVSSTLLVKSNTYSLCSRIVSVLKFCSYQAIVFRFTFYLTACKNQYAILGAWTPPYHIYYISQKANNQLTNEPTAQTNKRTNEGTNKQNSTEKN